MHGITLRSRLGTAEIAEPAETRRAVTLTAPGSACDRAGFAGRRHEQRAASASAEITAACVCIARLMSLTGRRRRPAVARATSIVALPCSTTTTR